MTTSIYSGFGWAYHCYKCPRAGSCGDKPFANCQEIMVATKLMDTEHLEPGWFLTEREALEHYKNNGGGGGD